MLTIALGHACNDLYMSFLAPLLPLLIAEFGLSKTQAGLLALIRQLPSLIQPAMGHMADRFSLHSVVIFAPAMTGAMCSLLTTAPSYTSLALLLLAAGISNTAFHSVAPAMAAQLAGTDNMGRTMGFWILGGELGFTIGPLLIAAIVEQFGPEATPWLMVFGIWGSVVLFGRLRRPTSANLTYPAHVPWRQVLTPFARLLVPLLGIAATSALLREAISTYLPTFLSEEGVSLWLSGASLTVYQAAASVGVVIAGSMSDRVGRVPVLLVSLLLTPLLMLSFLRVSGLGQVLMLVGMGLAAAAFDPVAMALVQDNAGQHRALASSLYLALMFLIRSIGAVAVGALADRTGMRQAYASSAWVFLLGAPLLLLLPARHKREPILG